MKSIQTIFLTAILLISITVKAQIPYMVKDINIGSGTGTQLGSLQGGIIFNDILYFSANDGVYGIEIWRSDGTANGTWMLKDINVGASGSGYFYYAFIWNNILFFTTNDGVSGLELWRTDGTTNGTYMVKDIWNGLGQSSPKYFSDSGNGFFYFVANDGINGEELWRSDGTETGTSLVKDINPGTASATISNYIVNNGYLYFGASDGVNGKELWKSDGTSTGTNLLKDINPSGQSEPRMFVEYNDTIYFLIENKEVWKSDGSTIGTDIHFIPTNGFVSDLFAASSKLFIANYHYSSPDEFKIYGSDGNSTILLYSFTHYSSGFGSLLQENNGKTVYINSCSNPNPDDIFILSDGSPGGTSMVFDALDEAVIQQNSMAFYNNEWYFSAWSSLYGSVELFKSDGINTTCVKDINSVTSYNGNAGSWLFQTTIFNNKLYFIANDGNTGAELWETDGTANGTNIVKDIYIGSNSCISNPASGLYFFPKVSGNNMFFVADDGIYGHELWCISTVTGVNEINNSAFNNFNIFPNPSSDKITIEYELNRNAVVGYRITDLVGKTVMQKDEEYQILGNNSTDILIQNLVSGFYLIEVIEGDKAIKVLKFQKL